jgi:hypothetical protein
MSKDKNILSKHPEAANNGRGYFNFETNRIPQEVVHHNENNYVHPNPYELTAEDLMGLAAYAVGLVDSRIYDYDKDAAIEDALLLATRSKDNGKFDGKISFNTGVVVKEIMSDLLGGSPKKASEESDDTEEKEAAKGREHAKVFNVPGPKVQIKKDQIKKQPGSSGRKIVIDTGRDNNLRKFLLKSAEGLDEVASKLEATGNQDLIKLASDLDAISNTLESLNEG